MAKKKKKWVIWSVDQTLNSNFRFQFSQIINNFFVRKEKENMIIDLKKKNTK